MTSTGADWIRAEYSGDENFLSSKSETVTELVPGTYTITEEEPTNGTSLVGKNGIKVEVTPNDTAGIPTAQFTNNKDVGSLIIKKNVRYNGEETTSTKVDGTYEFTVTGPNEYSEIAEITIKDGKSNTKTLAYKD